MDWYNNHTNGNWDNRVYVTGKAIIPDGKNLKGTFSLESGSCADSCTEKEPRIKYEKLKKYNFVIINSLVFVLKIVLVLTASTLCNDFIHECAFSRHL